MVYIRIVPVICWLNFRWDVKSKRKAFSIA
jgi:hypothetical protein